MKKKGEIVFTKYNPYTVVNTKLVDAEGKEIKTDKVYTLCRCGKSKYKPFCDGHHNSNGFTGDREKEPKKGTRDYVGEKITIHDNRYICSHHGACVLEDVFDSDSRPWINPDGSEDIEAVISIIKLCPSGALSYTIGDQKVDEWFKEQVIIVSKDGPYHVRGSVELIDDLESSQILISREHYTLCRCGESKKKPFCDGSHEKTGFKG